MKAHINWLEGELASWTRESLVSEESAAKILARYRDEVPRANWTTAIFAAFGATLIGLGIVSISAYNWEYLPREARAASAILILLCANAFGLYAKLKKPQSAAYAEGAGLFIAVAFAASLAIIAQTYHLGGSLPEFIKVVIALTLPVIYIFNAKGASAIFFIAIISLICADVDRQTYAMGWVYLGAWAPWYIFRLIYRRSSNITQAFNLLFMCGAVAVLNTEIVHSSIRFVYIYNALFFAFFWLASALLYANEPKASKRLVEEIAKFAIAFMLLLASTGEGLFGNYRGEVVNGVFYLLCMLYFSLFGFFALKLRDRLWELIIPIAPFVFYLAAVNDVSGEGAKWLFSLACLIGGASFIYGGIKRLNITLANQGVVWLGVLFALKFFDSELGLIEKGIGFIVVGLAFLAAGILISRYIKDAK
ncbi:MAG: DUF2157 domain-containing protein [Helicobacteraceae bacterium]|jgi:uncharacterized membrane protein|nr:DUF2157 domain-containing protein [Helicobacteraceae bacterium]